MQIQELSLNAIRPSPANPRILRDDDPDLASLAQSIREKGVLSPVLVRPRGEATAQRLARTLLNQTSADREGFELIAGERRFRASKLAGLETIPAIVRTDLSEQEALELTVTENLQREDLHPLEEANGVASLLRNGADLASVADRLGKPLGWVARRARLAKLSPGWRKLAEDPKSPVSAWPATMLELVARLEPVAQDDFLEAHDDWIELDHFDANDLRGAVADFVHELRLAPWKLDDALLEPQAGSCSACPKRSSCNPGLFDDEPETKKAKPGDRCLDATCWGRKTERWLERKAESLEAEHGSVVFGGHGAVPKFVERRGVKKLVSPWDGDDAKKGEKGAVPVLVVAGHDRGKVLWRRFGKSASPAARKAAAGADGKPKPMSLAERRKKLEARRQAFALEAICEAVEKASPPSNEELIVLASVFGTEHTFDRPSDYSLGKPIKLLPLPALPNARPRLWESVAAVVTKRWKTSLSWHGQKGLAERQPEISAIAQIIGLDLAPFAAKAAEAIPETKSWAKLAEGAKAKKKAAPAKAKKGKAA